MAQASNRGGKRTGAGRKPSDYSTSAVLDLDPSPVGNQITSAGRPIEAWKLTSASFLALGLSISEIARRLKRDRVTIRKMRDEHPELVLQAVRQLTNPADVFAPMLPEAAATYHQALASRDSNVARDVFDRLYGKPVVREQRTERREVRITFVDASDDGA